MDDSKAQKPIIINSKLLQIRGDGVIIIFQNGLRIIILGKMKSHLAYVL